MYNKKIAQIVDFSMFLVDFFVKIALQSAFAFCADNIYAYYGIIKR